MICATDDPDHGMVCNRNASCTVNFLWVRVRDAISGALESMTLAELVPLRLAPPAKAPAGRGASQSILNGAVSNS